MDLNDEELKATRELNLLLKKIKNTPDDIIEKAIDSYKQKHIDNELKAINKIIAPEEEKSADELFKEFGYKKLTFGKSQIQYCYYNNEESYPIRSVRWQKYPRCIAIEGYFPEKDLEAITQLCKERCLLKNE